MANRYFIKKIIYGFGFLAAFFLIAVAFYFLFLRSEPTCFDGRKNQGESGIDCGGPCEDCEIKRLSMISERWVKYFPTDKGTIIAAEIKNPNSDYGADNFSYTFEIFGENGEKINAIAKKSFIYAGEIRCLFEYIEINPQKIGEVKISLSDVHWMNANFFSKPEMSISKEVETSLKEGGKGLQTTGVIINQNPFSISRAKIVAFLTDGFGVDIMASKTELENIDAFEERQFKIIFPASISVDSVNKTRICVEAAR